MVFNNHFLMTGEDKRSARWQQPLAKAHPPSSSFLDKLMPVFGREKDLTVTRGEMMMVVRHKEGCCILNTFYSRKGGVFFIYVEVKNVFICSFDPFYF